MIREYWLWLSTMPWKRTLVLLILFVAFVALLALEGLGTGLLIRSGHGW